MPIPPALLQESAVPNEWPTLSFSQYTDGSQSFELRDSYGATVTLDDTTQTATLFVKEYERSSSVYLEVPCAISGNTVTATIDAADLIYSGVWLGEAVLTTTATDAVVRRMRCYIEIEPSLSTTNSYAPISVAEVRMALRDRAPQDNDLLEKVEFSTTEIVWAIRRPVEFWNECLPPIDANYTPATFPYRYAWLDGITGELLKMASMNLNRNRRPSQIGGGSMVDPNARGELYLKLGSELIEKYQAWVRAKKYSLNVEESFTSTSIDVFG